MGCDVHMYLEKVSIAKRRDEVISSLLGVKEADIKANWELIESDIFGGRSYNLFGKLANVRTREGIIPLDDPRGVPNDASKDYLEEVKHWGWNAHSHSYFYLPELVKVDWTDISQEMGELVERLKRENKDLDTIRIVFFFDN